MNVSNTSNPFSNLFDIENQDFDKLVIKESHSKDNCLIYHESEIIGGFILITKKNVKTILKVFNIEIVDPNVREENEEEEDKKPFITVPFTDVARDDKIFPIVFTAYQNGLLDNMGQELKPNSSAARYEVAYWVSKFKFDYLN